MILIYIILILMIGGILSLLLRKNPVACKWISLLAVLVDFIMMVVYWIMNYDNISVLKEGSWIVDIKKEWIPEWGASFHFAMDGLSLVMVVLTLFLGLVAVLVTWKKTIERVGFFYLNILWLLAGVLGVFLSLDLFLFYFFWELMLIPMFFIISIWGHKKRNTASVKFFLFTQAGGMLMLIAILALYFIHGRSTGVYTFDYFELLGTQLSPTVALWLMLGFLAAFVVKLPLFPFHSWLPDAYTESPVSGTIILAGLLSKTAAYGILRFILPIFPDAAKEIAPYAVIVGIISILYGAKLAFAQTNLKRLIAFSSMSHMGFIIVGIFSFQALAYQGVVLEMVAHAITIGALFVIAGAINDRIHTLDLDKMGGFWAQVPVMGGITTVFVLASLGLPSLGNFIAEFLILSGTFQTYTILAVLAALGLIASMIYSLVILQRIFHGRERSVLKLPDFSAREKMVMGSLIIVIFWIGLFPQTIFNTVKTPDSILKPQTVSLQIEDNYPKDLNNEYASQNAVGWWGHQPWQRVVGNAASWWVNQPGPRAVGSVPTAHNSSDHTISDSYRIWDITNKRTDYITGNTPLATFADYTFHSMQITKLNRGSGLHEPHNKTVNTFPDYSFHYVQITKQSK